MRLGPRCASLRVLVGLLAATAVLAVGPATAGDCPYAFTPLFANLHVHTSASTNGYDHLATASPADTVARCKTQKLDVVGLADHGDVISKAEWEELKTVAAAAGDSPRCLVGCEWTPWNLEHINFFGLSRPFYSRTSAWSDPGYFALGLTDLKTRLRSFASQPVAQFNHPSAAAGDTKPADPFDAFTCDPALLKVITLMEVGSGPDRALYSEIDDNEPYFWKALRGGWLLAPTIGVDNQTNLLPFAYHRCTGIWSEGRGEEQVLEALRQRRTWATEVEGLTLSFWAESLAGGAFMGGYRPCETGDELTFRWEVGTKHDLKSQHLVEVMKSGTPRSISLDKKATRYVAKIGDNTLCYYLWIRTDDGPALSAPIWVRHVVDPEAVATTGPRFAGIPETEKAVKAGAAVDLIFCIDTTGSMADDIADVKTNAANLISTTRAKCPDLRLGLVTYRDFAADASGHLETIVPLTSDFAAVEAAIQAIEVGGGGDDDEDVLDGLKAALDMKWRPGVIKLITLLGDAPAKDPDHAGNTTASICKYAEELDPVHVYSLACGGVSKDSPTWASFSAISEGTGAAVLPVAEADVLSEVLGSTIAAAVDRHASEASAAGGGVPAEDHEQTYLLLVVSASILILFGIIGVATKRGRERPAPQPPATAAWSLSIAEPQQPARVVRLAAPIVFVGSAAGNQVVLRDPHVSSRHLQVRRTPQGYLLQDLGSRTGTWLAHQRLAGPTLVAPGSTVRVGATMLTLH